MVRSWDQRLRGANAKKVAGNGESVSNAPVEEAEDDPKLVDRRKPEKSTPVKPSPDQPERVPADQIKRSTNGLGIKKRTRSTDKTEETKPADTADPAVAAKPAAEASVDVPVESKRGLAAGLQAALVSAEVPVLVVTGDSGAVIWSSPQWTKLFGSKNSLDEFMPVGHDAKESEMPNAGDTKKQSCRMVMADGTEDLYNLSLIGIDKGDDNVVTVVAFERSISSAVVSERSEVVEVIDGSIAAASQGSVGVLCLELDDFDTVVGQLDEEHKEVLLDEVMKKLGGLVRGTDLVFRLDTDGFVIVACEMEAPHVAKDLAQRVREALGSITEPAELTGSIGLATWEEGVAGSELIASAESAVGDAKNKGGDRVIVHDAEANERLERQKEAELQLRQALDRNQIQFNYQPVVEMSTGRVVGAEALLRFGGDVTLSAAEVVAAAEASNMMGTLGITVVDGVTRELGDWLKEPDLEQVIMINLSASQLEDTQLAARLEVVASEGYPDRRLALEVPEVVVRSHRKAYMKLARKLSGTFLMGIDGFGTSDSSVEMLAGLPLDYIKLHRSVTAGLAGTDEKMAPLVTLLEQAEDSGIMVIALGVESRIQAEELQGVNCPLGQGFLFASAVTADRLMDLSTVGFSPAKASN